MIRLLGQSLIRHLAQARVLHGLTVLGVSLGVATVVSIQILNRSAVAAFQGSVESIRGEADLSVFGSSATLDETALVEVLATDGVHGAWPVVNLSLAIPGDEPRRYLDLVGLDVMALAGLPYVKEFDTAAALSSPWVALTPEAVRQLDRNEGDTLEVSCGTRQARLVIGNLVELEQLGPSASPMRGVMDIAQLQQLLGQPGRIHQVNVEIAPDRTVEQVAAALTRRLGSSFEVLTPQEQVRQAEELMGAFRLNLTALSVVSLFVGFFVVYTTVQAGLVRRRRELGVLRCLGATRGQLVALVLGEVLVLGLCGTVLGGLLGLAGARASLADISATLTNLYVLEEVRSLSTSPWLIPLAIATGVGGALCGALPPVLEHLRRDPRQLLASFPVQEGLARIAVRAGLLGLLLPAAALTWYLTIGREWKPAGFLLGLTVLLSLPLVAPWLLSRSFRWLRPSGFGVLFGVRSLAGRLHGSSFCIASLAISVSILVGITMMVQSFRGTLERWVDAVIQADVYVTTESYARSRTDAVLEPALVERLTTQPGVHHADLLRRHDVKLDGRPVPLIGVRMDLPDGTHRFPLVDGDPGPVYAQLRDQPAVLISQPLARRLALGPGDRLPLPEARDTRPLTIAGVYEDYGSENGAVAMDLEVMQSVLGPGPLNSVSLYLEAGREVDAVVAALRRDFAGQPLVVRSNARLREEVFRIFDQTFLITRTLQLVTLVVAALGIATTLLVLAEEQRPELALARSLGAQRRQVFSIFLGKGSGIGALGTLLGMAGGVSLALILVRVINQAYFGWTIQPDWSSLFMTRELGTIAGVVLLACLYPAWKASRTPATELSHHDR